jgi:ABC-2 type transport system permease protein
MRVPCAQRAVDLARLRHPLRSMLSDNLVIARRRIADARRIPGKLIDVTLQPLMFVPLFACAFGGVIDVPGDDYRAYPIGGIHVQKIAFGMVAPRTALATHLSPGGLSTATFAVPSSRLCSASARKRASV